MGKVSSAVFFAVEGEKEAVRKAFLLPPEIPYLVAPMKELSIIVSEEIGTRGIEESFDV